MKLTKVINTFIILGILISLIFINSNISKLTRSKVITNVTVQNNCK